MEYQLIPDPAQLQLLEELLRMVLHGVLIVMGGASVLLLCLCLSELRFPWRRVPEVEGLAWKWSGDALPAARSRASLDDLTPIRLWAGGAEGGAPTRSVGRGVPGPGAADLSGGCVSADTTPALWLGQRERGSGWGEPVEVR